MVKAKEYIKVEEKLPLARPTSSLAAKYSIGFNEDDIVKKYVPAKDTHAQLQAAEEGYREKYLQIYKSKSAPNTLSAANIVTANLSFLYSDATLEEGSVGSLDISSMPVIVPDDYKYTLNVSNFFNDDYSYEAAGIASNKGSRNSIFDTHIQRRIGLFSQYDNFASTTALTTAKGFGLQVRKANFHEVFHHSEQAVMEYFSSESGRKFITDNLKSLHAGTVGGIILDMYSTRYMCDNCNVNLIGFQNTQKKGAIYDITRSLHNLSIDTPEEGLLWSTRVSASEEGRGTHYSPTKKTTDAGFVHTISMQESYLVLQADSTKLGSPKRAENKGYSLDTYSGDFFTSREISKVKMEKSLGNRAALL